MKIIRSKDNPAFKDVQRLLRKKYRDQTGMFLLEGPRPVIDALQTDYGIDTVFVSASAAHDPQAAEIIALCEERGCSCVLLADGLYDRISDTEHSQGVLASARKPVPRDPGEQILILDRLQDPGNIGTIIRTAEASGFSSLIAIKGTGDLYAPKTARAAAGSLLRVAVFESMETTEAIAFCREQGMKITVSDLEGSVAYTQADLTGRIALVIGNEGSGISEEMRAAADSKVRIPMEGNIESLNAAVAAGILMYEAKRQRQLQER